MKRLAALLARFVRPAARDAAFDRRLSSLTQPVATPVNRRSRPVATPSVFRKPVRNALAH